MLHCHLQNVRFLQFRVSGALGRNKEEGEKWSDSHLIAAGQGNGGGERLERDAAQNPDGLQTYIFFKRVQDERLQLTQALVDSGSSPLFHDWLG